MGMLKCGNENRATQTMTEATVATLQECLPAIQRSAIEWWCLSKGVEYDGKDVPPEDDIPLKAGYREMLKVVLGKMALKLEVVYLCPDEDCDGHRRTKDFKTPCPKCGSSYYYEDSHGHVGVCTLRYYPMATLIRYLYADPLKARHLRETFMECVPEPDAMSGVYGESRRRPTRLYSFITASVVFDCLLPYLRLDSFLGYPTP